MYISSFIEEEHAKNLIKVDQMLILIPYVYGFHWRRQCIYLSSKFKTVNKGSYTWVVEEENSHGTIKASLYHVFTFHICNDLLERPKSDRTVFYSICIWFALVKKMPKVYRSSKNIKCIQLSLNEKMERLRIKDFCHFVLMSYISSVSAVYWHQTIWNKLKFIACHHES